MNTTRQNKPRIPTRRRCAVESRGGRVILNHVQGFAARDGWHLFGRYAKKMPILKQYSFVRIAVLHKAFDQSNVEKGFDRRLPRVGDLATIVEVYQSPSLGYELECSNPDGTNEWLVTFSPEDADFEVVSTPDEVQRTKIRARTVASFSAGTIRILVGVGHGQLDGGVPFEVDADSVPVDFRMPNTEFYVFYDRKELQIVGYEPLNERA